MFSSEGAGEWRTRCRLKYLRRSRERPHEGGASLEQVLWHLYLCGREED